MEWIGERNERHDPLRVIAMTSDDEVARVRRFSRCLGWHFVGPTAIADRLDRSAAAWILVSRSGEVALCESGAASEAGVTQGSDCHGSRCRFRYLGSVSRDYCKRR